MREHPRFGNPRRKRKSVVRTTEVKIRVRVHRRMTRATLLAKLLDVIHGGAVPRDFDIEWWDYAHKRGGSWRHGDQVSGDDLAGLEQFVGMIGTIAEGKTRVGGRANVRMARVDETGYEE